MRFSLEWLRTHLEIPEPPETVARLLADAGLPADAVTPFGADVHLDLDVPSNRPDCMSHAGLARELAARLGRPTRTPPADPPATGARPAGDLVGVQVEAPDLCSRYTALVLTGVRVGESPEWLRARLLAIGQRPVNNVVDVTNFVLHDLGLPLHAFDLDRLEGARIRVRRATAGEALRTLDGQDRRLDADMLVIADASRPVALAGVMGGQATEITAATQRVLLEAAHFEPLAVRRAARRAGLHTDASHRFERGTDPAATLVSARRAAALLIEVAGAALAPGEVDAVPRPAAPRVLDLRLTRLALLLGLPVDEASARRSLVRLGFAVAGPRGDVLSVTVPTWRVDVEREEDLIEEVGRQIGYDAIPLRVPAGAVGEEARPSPALGPDRARRCLAAAGFAETLSFPMSDPERQALLGPPGAGLVRLDNPVAPQMAVLRSSLLPGLLAALAHNRNRGRDAARLFEIGRVFEEAAAGRDGMPAERLGIAAVACGGAVARHWRGGAPPYDAWDLLGVVETLGRRVLDAPLTVEPAEDGLPAAFEPGVSGRLHLAGRPAGVIGALRPEHAARLEVAPQTVLFELILDRPPARPPARPVRPIPRHPAAERDLALLLDVGVPYSRVAAAAAASGGPLLESMEPFDRWTGRGIPAGKVGLGLRLVFRHGERTLQAAEIRAALDAVVARLEAECGATLREAPSESGAPGRNT